MFGRRDATVTEPEISGTEALRARVKSRRRRAHLARTAVDLSIALPQLDAFADGGSLPEAAIHALVKEFYVNAKWDPVADRLIDTSPSPPKAGLVPEPLVPLNPDVAKAQADYFAALRAAAPPPATRPAVPGAESAGRWPKRPGFR